jgi:hypothetical protein
MTKAPHNRPVRNTHNRNFGKANPRMARPENDSAKRSPPWLAEYDLDTFKGVDNFAKELLRLTWVGDLGTRQSGNCLAILRLLLERRLWLPMSSDRLNPELGKYGRASPEKGKEDVPSPQELSPEAEAAVAAVKKQAAQLSKELGEG